MKKRYIHDLGHDLTVLAFSLALITGTIVVFKKNTQLDNLYEENLKKQQEINIAWDKVNEAQKRKEQLEADALKVEERIAALNKQKDSIINKYKRIERIQKDLDRIIGK